MFEWLKGPGKVFREPLPGSTNYLSAYDRQGNLIRASANNRSNRPNDNYDDSELKEDEGEIQRRELEEGISEEEVGRRAEQRIKRRGEKAELEARGGVPKEQPRDLRPYPLNQQFRSQPVLSEELREKIYELIVLDRIDLKSVSATFGVDIRRVAAVVRLKSLEKQWVAEVSSGHSSSSCFVAFAAMMISIPNSISLEDSYMVTNERFASLSDIDNTLPFMRYSHVGSGRLIESNTGQATRKAIQRRCTRHASSNPLQTGSAKPAHT